MNNKVSFIIFFLILLILFLPIQAYTFKTGKGDVWCIGCSKNYIVIGSSNHKLYLFNTSGKLVWVKDTGNWVRSVDTNGKYIAAGSGDYICLYGINGNLLWKYRTGGWIRGIKIVGDEIIAGSSDHKVYALNFAGKILWTYDTGNWVWCLDSDGRRIAVGSGGKVLLLNLNGKLLWSYDTGNWNWVKSISIKNGYVVAGTRDFKVFFFNDNGKLLWTYGTGNVWSVDTNGKYVVVGADKVYFLNRTGKLLWSYKTKSNWVLSTCISNDGEYIAAGSRDTYAYIFNKDGKLLWKYKTDGWVRKIAICDGKVVVGARNIYFLGINSKLNNTSAGSTTAQTPGFGVILAAIAIIIGLRIHSRQ